MLDERARDHDADVGVDGRVCGRIRRLLVELADILRRCRPLGQRLVVAHRLGRVRHLLPTVDVALATDAARLERLAPRDAHVAVRLLVVDERIARELGLGLGRAAVGRVDLRRLEHVKLADLRVAREHLHRVLVVRDLKRLRRHNAAAAEGARLEAGDARLEARLGRGAALFVGCARDARCQGEWGRSRRGIVSTVFEMADGALSLASGARAMYSSICGGMMSMFGL